jgi:hypothetical protein
VNFRGRKTRCDVSGRPETELLAFLLAFYGVQSHRVSSTMRCPNRDGPVRSGRFDLGCRLWQRPPTARSLERSRPRATAALRGVSRAAFSQSLGLRRSRGWWHAQVPEHSVNPCLVVSARNVALGGELAAQDTGRRILLRINEADVSQYGEVNRGARDCERALSRAPRCARTPGRIYSVVRHGRSGARNGPAIQVEGSSSWRSISTFTTSPSATTLTPGGSVRSMPKSLRRISVAASKPA